LPFIIMERIEGRQMWPEMQATATRPVLEQRFVDLLLQLHDLDVAPLTEGLSPADDGHWWLQRDVALWRTVVARAPVAGFAAALEWFATNLEDVQPLPPSVVHNDFHPGNVMITTTDDDLVIDWTYVDVADRRNDLAWTLMLMAVVDTEDASRRVANLYTTAAQAPDMDYFMAGAYVKRLFTLATSVVYGPETLGMRPEAVAEVRQHLAAATPLYDGFRRITGRSLEGVERLLTE
jgi:aminoglycoside phosphotransferase (APT) family kinase protein